MFNLKIHQLIFTNKCNIYNKLLINNPIKLYFSQSNKNPYRIIYKLPKYRDSQLKQKCINRLNKKSIQSHSTKIPS